MSTTYSPILGGMRKLATTLLLLIIIGCSTEPRVQIEQIGEYDSTEAPIIANMETPEDAARRELDEVSTDFTVPIQDALTAKERMDLFFSQYLGGKESVDTYQVTRSMGNGVLRKGASENFRYEVMRRPTPQGYIFMVRCFPSGGRGNRLDAMQNAKNLARFIRDGRLEQTLLLR